MTDDTTTLRVSKRTLALFNQKRAEEIGDSNEGNINQNDFMQLLLEIYTLLKSESEPNSAEELILLMARYNRRCDK